MKQSWLYWIYNILKLTLNARKTGFFLWHESLKCDPKELMVPLFVWPLLWLGSELSTETQCAFRCWDGIWEGDWLMKAQTHRWQWIRNLMALLGVSRSFPVGGSQLIGNALEMDILFPAPSASLSFPLFMRWVSLLHCMPCDMILSFMKAQKQWNQKTMTWSISQYKFSLLWWISLVFCHSFRKWGVTPPNNEVEKPLEIIWRRRKWFIRDKWNLTCHLVGTQKMTVW